MNRFPLILLCALILSAAATATAQQTGPRYRFDNFDTREGVRVDVPAPPAPAARASKKNVRLTAKSAAGFRPASPPPAPAAGEAPRAMSMAVSKSLDGFSTGDPSVDSFIAESGARHGVDPVLIYAIMHRESSFKKMAMSHKGARGLMQLMPATAARFGVTNIFDPRQNIDAGTRYMRFLLNFFDGDVRLALAGYNAGEGAVLKYGRRIPPYRETQEYVARITQRYALMRDPQTARRAPLLTPTQVANVKAKEKSEADNLYEVSVHAVRMPDGKLRLVSQ